MSLCPGDSPIYTPFNVFTILGLDTVDIPADLVKVPSVKSRHAHLSQMLAGMFKPDANVDLERGDRSDLRSLKQDYWHDDA